MKKRSTVSATDMRVRLGEMLRRLEDEDLVIEKGGIPVAVLSRYRPEGESRSAVDEAYERALSHKGDPSKWDEAFAAMREGWEGFDGEALKAEIYRRRDESVKYARYYMIDEGVPELEEPEESGEVLARLRYLHRRADRTTHVADRGDTEYKA